MKLISITAAFPGGSSEAFFIEEFKEIRTQGVELLIVPLYRRRALVNRDAAALVEVTLQKPVLSPTIAAIALWQIVRSPRRAARAFSPLLKSRNLTILAKNAVAYPKGLWLAWQARRWGADHLHSHWASVSATLAMVASEYSGIPWSFTAHRWDILENNLLGEKLGRARFGRFIADSWVQEAAKYVRPEALAKAVVHRMGVRLPAAPPRARDLPRPLPPLICSGALIERKGHRYLFEALASLRQKGIEIPAWIAGSGELESALKRMASELGIAEQVRFLGQLSHSDLLDLYGGGKVSAVVLPSLSEGIPVALIEAMGFAVPAISTAVGGTPELLGDGAGLLVPAQDSRALAGAIERLISEPGLARKLGEAGARRVRESYAVEPIVAGVIRQMRG
jgi:glycosyltransferase involved in cell wall biosynthesis